MKLFSFIFLFSLQLCVYGQFKPVYFIGEQIVADSTMATSYGVYGKLSGEELYVLKVFDLKNNLMTTGTYKDERLKIAHGAFVYYNNIEAFNNLNATNFAIKDKERFMSGKGFYTDGNKSGRWITFFPDGKIMNVTTYLNGVKHGFYGLYTRKGNMVISGTYYADEKDGEWQFDNGKVKETYIKGVKQLVPEKKEKKKQTK
jgi:hypothetical protein